ncbi:unnamed protein product [Strongylus vulgaris]|uniref:Uncharacterized protein n=1 Tax=Strongylus vulgaris TaxID=40348 RepID=A0A3P7JD62_STRVU|nr:unnamed protein product [Strongylus vulgaris]
MFADGKVGILAEVGLPMEGRNAVSPTKCAENQKNLPASNTVNGEFVGQKRRKLLMGLFDTPYLSTSHLKGFDSYKYSCIDSSPLSKYISHPFWNWIVNYYPRTWAPNVLTLLGWALVMGCFLLESSFQPDPHFAYTILRFWIVAAICTWLGYTLDGTDGKQARRIGASGPTGELCEFAGLECTVQPLFFQCAEVLVDHGLDSWSTVPFTITVFSVFGRGEFR